MSEKSAHVTVTDLETGKKIGEWDMLESGKRVPAIENRITVTVPDVSYLDDTAEKTRIAVENVLRRLRAEGKSASRTSVLIVTQNEDDSRNFVVEVPT